MNPSEALFDFNLAPLKRRRDISMLGFLHGIVLKDAPELVVVVVGRSNLIGIR